MAFAATCILAYAAGMATMGFATMAAGDPRKTAGERAEKTADAPTERATATSDFANRDAPLTAEQVRAEIARMQRNQPSRFASLRRLGDDYLELQKDPEGAVRCYRLALKYATPEELAHAMDESSWLMAALLNDLEREHDHAVEIN
jgi:hypothetical protein